MSGKPFPDPSHECVGSGEPILDAWTHQAIRRYPGATIEEITEKVLRLAAFAGTTDAYDRRMAALRVAEIMGSRPPGARRDDLTSEAVRAERARREAAGEPSGYGALATHFHASSSTIRRRLGVLAPK